MLAEVVDAVVGVDTHRDTHEVEIASPNGVPIAQCSIRNDSTGYAQLLAWIVDHAPGPRLVASVEGSRSYGVGLSRALSSAGVPVLEAEQPPQSARRGKGKSDAIDAHLAVLAALRLDATHLPAPRVDGDREALRILPRAAPHANHGDGGRALSTKAHRRSASPTRCCAGGTHRRAEHPTPSSRRSCWRRRHLRRPHFSCRGAGWGTAEVSAQALLSAFTWA